MADPAAAQSAPPSAAGPCGAAAAAARSQRAWADAGSVNIADNLCWAVTFIPMPMPKTVCVPNLYNKLVQLEVCNTCLGRGMGTNITAHM